MICFLFTLRKLLYPLKKKLYLPLTLHHHPLRSNLLPLFGLITPFSSQEDFNGFLFSPHVELLHQVAQGPHRRGLTLPSQAHPWSMAAPTAWNAFPAAPPRDLTEGSSALRLVHLDTQDLEQSVDRLIDRRCIGHMRNPLSLVIIIFATSRVRCDICLFSSSGSVAVRDKRFPFAVVEALWFSNLNIC